MNSSNRSRNHFGRSTISAMGVRTLGSNWPAAAVVFLAAIDRSVSWLNCDVSWLLTLGEQVLAGARPYIDFNETNPPACFLIYMPAILIAQTIGVTPECVVTAMVFAGAVLSILIV